MCSFGCDRQSPPAQEKGNGDTKAQSPRPAEPGEVTNLQLKAQLGDGKEPVQALQLCCFTMTDDDMKHLRGLKSLIALDLTGGGYTDEGLKEISDLTGLGELYLSDRAKITDAGIAHLRRLTGLRVLRLAGPGITDGCIKDLRELKGLKELSIQDTAITESGLKDLKQALPNTDIKHHP
jgi:hypothetical protein